LVPFILSTCPRSSSTSSKGWDVLRLSSTRHYKIVSYTGILIISRALFQHHTKFGDRSWKYTIKINLREGCCHDMNWTKLGIESKGGLLFGTCKISCFHNTMKLLNIEVSLKYIYVNEIDGLWFVWVYAIHLQRTQLLSVFDRWR
jgi:hypothetical protein